MSDHEIEWEFDAGTVRMKVICNEPNTADCHLEPADDACQCEEFGGFGRDTEGAFHLAYNSDADDEAVKHRLAPGNFCNVVLFMDEADEPMEDGPAEAFIIGRTPVDFIWNGDWYTWRKGDDR